jgi:hypothetical protein
MLFGSILSLFILFVTSYSSEIKGCSNETSSHVPPWSAPRRKHCRPWIRFGRRRWTAMVQRIHQQPRRILAERIRGVEHHWVTYLSAQNTGFHLNNSVQQGRFCNRYLTYRFLISPCVSHVILHVITGPEIRHVVRLSNAKRRGIFKMFSELQTQWLFFL